MNLNNKDLLELIHPNSKQQILVCYHKKVKEICKNNEILFIEIEIKGEANNILRDTESIFLKKSTSAFDEDDEDYEKFKRLIENFKNLYIIGIFRNGCLINTLLQQNFFEKFKIFTSFIGTGNFSSDKTILKNELDEFRKISKKKNVKIIDYHK